MTRVTSGWQRHLTEPIGSETKRSDNLKAQLRFKHVGGYDNGYGVLRERKV